MQVSFPVNNQRALFPFIDCVVAFGNVSDEVSGIVKANQPYFLYASGSFDMPFAIPTFAVDFLFPDPQAYLARLSPYCLCHFVCNFPKVLLRRSLNRALEGEAEGKVFSHTYMLAQDAERARISRELHDTVLQDMRHVDTDENTPSSGNITATGEGDGRWKSF